MIRSYRQSPLLRQPHMITTRYAGTCRTCLRRIPQDTRALYDPAARQLECEPCSRTGLALPPEAARAAPTIVRPIWDMIDFQPIAVAHGLAKPRAFVPIAPPAAAQSLEDLEPSAILATVADAAGERVEITAQMLRDYVDATNEPHCRRTASRLAVIHLRSLADDPDFLR